MLEFRSDVYSETSFANLPKIFLEFGELFIIGSVVRSEKSVPTITSTVIWQLAKCNDVFANGQIKNFFIIGNDKVINFDPEIQHIKLLNWSEAQSRAARFAKTLTYGGNQFKSSYWLRNIINHS